MENRDPENQKSNNLEMREALTDNSRRPSGWTAAWPSDDWFGWMVEEIKREGESDVTEL